MKTRAQVLVILAATVIGASLFGAAASAADLPVTYKVQDKALKAAATGTVLSFDLYTDSACTDPYFSQTVAIDDVDVITKLKRFFPKNGAKPPKTDEIRAVLADVPAVEGPYLRVTGTGITPAGDDCQIQTSGIQGPQGQSGVVTVADFHGATGPMSPDVDYAFYGPTVVVTTTATQRVTGTAVTPLGRSSGVGDVNVAVALCLRSTAGGPMIPLNDANTQIAEVTSGARHTFTVAGSKAPGAGTWTAGFCARNDGGAIVDDNGNIMGWVMVTN